MSDDLPTPSGNNPIIPEISGGINKEIANASIGSTESALPKESGQEATDTLPKEVTSAGVTIHPTTIPIPLPVSQMGVRAAGANIPMPTAVAIPITDDQIALGLGKSIRDSFRWLAEWCVRRLKQVHVGLQSVHGKLTRVQTH